MFLLLKLGGRRLPLSKRDLEWSEDDNYYNYQTQPKEEKIITHTQKPNDFSSVQKKTVHKPQPKRRLNSRGVVVIGLLLVFYVFCIVPVFIKNVTKFALFGIKSNSQIKVENYNYLYNPTIKYINNSEFLNTKMLVNTPKKQMMTPLTPLKELTTLKKSLQNEIAGYNRIEPAIFVYDVENGNFVDINGDKTYSAASVIKIPVLISMFKTVEAGKFNLNDTMQLEEHYISSGSGGLQYRMQKQDLSFDKLARLMITDSDNTATNMIMSMVGSMVAVNNDINSWGLKNTHIKTWLPDLTGTNYTSPKDLATMLLNLDNEKFLSVDSRAHIFDYMGHVKNNRLLAAGIPNGASIAHKTGDIGSALSDAGIIYTTNGRKYIVAIMVKRPHNDHSAKEFIVKASETIYNYMANY